MPPAPCFSCTHRSVGGGGPSPLAAAIVPHACHSSWLVADTHGWTDAHLGAPRLSGPCRAPGTPSPPEPSPPLYPQNQVRREISCALRSLPWISVPTVALFFAEVRGYSKLYDNIEDSPYGELLPRGPPLPESPPSIPHFSP